MYFCRRVFSILPYTYCNCRNIMPIGTNDIWNIQRMTLGAINWLEGEETCKILCINNLPVSK